MHDKIINFLTILAIIGILCLILHEVLVNASRGERIGGDAIDWRIERINDLEAQKTILLYKLGGGYGEGNSGADNKQHS